MEQAHADRSASQCGFRGDDNMYGLGIRLGLYCQWATTFLANNLVPEEAVTMRGVNNCFQAAMFVGLLYMMFSTHDEREDVGGPSKAGATPSGATASEADSRRAASLHAAEVFVVLVLCIGGVCSGRGRGNAIHGVMADPAEGGSGSSTSALCTATTTSTFAAYKSSTIGQLIQLLLASTVAFFATWFAFRGMDHIGNPGSSPPRRQKILASRAASPSPPPPPLYARRCRTWVFFFAKIDAYGRFRHLLKGVFVLAAAATAVLVIIAFAGLVADCRRLGAARALALLCKFGEEDDSPASRAVPPPPPSPLPPPATSSSERLETEGRATTTTTLKGTTLSLDLVVFVLFNELTIKWNHIDGVNSIRSAGQLLPLVVGGSGLVRVTYKAMFKVLRGDYLGLERIHIRKRSLVDASFLGA